MFCLDFLFVRMLLIICSLFLLLDHVEGKVPNECQNKTTGIWQCCSDFEDVNGTCVACKLGYSSSEGSNCVECKTGSYGDRCLKKCNNDCSVSNCHHIHGCTLITNGYETAFTDYPTTIENRRRLVSTENIEAKTSDITTSGDTTDTTHTMNSDTGKSGDEILELKIYIGILTGVLLIMLMSFAFYKCHHVRKRNKTIVVQNKNEITENNETENGDFGAQREPDELSEVYGEYHTIDESKMIETPGNPYLDIIDDSSSYTSVGSGKQDRDSYLKPYTILVDSIDVHPYQENMPNNSCPDRQEETSYEQAYLDAMSRPTSYLIPMPSLRKNDIDKSRSCTNIDFSRNDKTVKDQNENKQYRAHSDSNIRNHVVIPNCINIDH